MGGTWSAFPILDGLWGIVDDPPWDWDPSRTLTSPPWQGIHVGVQSVFWDEMGYKPFGAKSPWDYWSMTKDLQPNAFTQASADIPDTNNIQLGLTDDVLGVIGAPVVYVRKNWADKTITNTENTSTFLDAIPGTAPQAAWYSEQYTDQNQTYCNPFNYPNCDMSLVASSTGSVVMWDGTKIDVIKRWAEKVDAIANAYTRGEFDWLVDTQRVNPSRTDNFDQCAGKFVDDSELFGLFLGLGLPVAFNVAMVIVIPIPLPTITRLTISAGLFSYGYYFGQFATSTFTKDSVDRNRLLLQSSTALGISAGAAGGSLVGALLEPDGTMPIVMAAAGGVAGYHFLIPYLKTYLNTYTMSGSEFLGGLLNLYTSYMSEMANVIKCQLESVTLTACMDSNEFPRARRWDSASIAVMLLDEVINPPPNTPNPIKGAGTIKKGSPEAEFIFRGLLTGPAMMMSGVSTPDNTWTGVSGNSLYENSTYWGTGTGANPLGPLCPYGWRFHGDTGEYTLDWFYLNDGYFSKAAAQSLGQNEIACNTWAYIRSLQYIEEGDGTNAFAANTNWNKWLTALIAASQNPANLKAQESIPGWNAPVNPITNGPLPLKPVGYNITIAYYRAHGSSFGTLAKLAEDAAQGSNNDPKDSWLPWALLWQSVSTLAANATDSTSLTNFCQFIGTFKSEQPLVTDTIVQGWLTDWLAPVYSDPTLLWVKNIYTTSNCVGPKQSPPPGIALERAVNAWKSANQSSYSNMVAWVTDSAEIAALGAGGISAVGYAAGTLAANVPSWPNSAQNVAAAFPAWVQQVPTGYEAIYLKFLTTPVNSLQKEWTSAWTGFESGSALVSALVANSSAITPLPVSLVYSKGTTVNCPNDMPNFMGAANKAIAKEGFFYAGIDAFHYYEDAAARDEWDPNGVFSTEQNCSIFLGGADIEDPGWLQPLQPANPPYVPPILKTLPPPPPTLKLLPGPPPTLQQVLVEWQAASVSSYHDMLAWSAQFQGVLSDTDVEGIRLAAQALSGSMPAMYASFNQTVFVSHPEIKPVFLMFATTPVTSLENEWRWSWKNFNNNSTLVADLAANYSVITPLPPTLMYAAGTNVVCVNTGPTWPGGHTDTSNTSWFYTDIDYMRAYQDVSIIRKDDPTHAHQIDNNCQIYLAGPNMV